MDVIDAPETMVREYKGIISATELVDIFVKQRHEELESPRVYRRQFYLIQATLLDSVC